MSGPTKTEAQIIFPFPTGLCSFASISIVSVSQACILSGRDFSIETTLLASSLVRTMVVASIYRFFMASLTPVFKVLSFGVGSITTGSLGTTTFRALLLAFFSAGDSFFFSLDISESTSSYDFNVASLKIRLISSDEEPPLLLFSIRTLCSYFVAESVVLSLTSFLMCASGVPPLDLRFLLFWGTSVTSFLSSSSAVLLSFSSWESFEDAVDY